MPAVPKQDAQTVFGQPAGGNYISVPNNPDAFGAGVGRGLASVADATNTIAINQQAINNETAVNDADANQFSPAVRDIRNQYLQLQGKDAVDQLPDVQQKIQDLRNETRSNLANPKQQQMFDTISRKRVEIELDGLVRYGDQQNKVYQEKTFRSGLENMTNQAADNYNDESRFGYSLGSAQSLIDNYGTTHGWSSDQMKAEEAKFVSTAQTQRVQRWAQDDPIAAQDYYQRHTGDFEAAIRPNIEKLLKNSVDPILQRDAAERITTGATTGNVATPDTRNALHDAVKYTESHNDPAAVSPKGAEGTMQVMPGTQGDPGFGVRPAANRSPAELERVGHDYLDAMLTRYGGNQTAALAAYNWGPGRVDNLIASGATPGSAQFTAALPAETQQYIAKINGKVPPADATPTTTTDVKLQLPTWIAQAKATAEAMRPGDTVFADGMVTRVIQKANIIEAGTRAVADNARDVLTAALVKIKGENGATFDEYMGQPEVKTAWNAATPEMQLAIQSRFKDANANGPPRTAESFSLFNTLLGRSVNPDPGVRAQFAKEDLTQYYDKMPYADLHQIVVAQKSINQGYDKDAAKQLNLVSALHTADNQVFNMAGLGAPKATDGQSKKDTRDQLVNSLNTQLENFAETHKRNPTQEEIAKIARGLTATVSTPGKLISSWTNQTQAFKLTPEQEATATVTLPPAERTSLTTGFSNRYGRAPSESEVQQLALAQRLHSTDPAYLAQLDAAFRGSKKSAASGLAAGIPQ